MERLARRQIGDGDAFRWHADMLGDVAPGVFGDGHQMRHAARRRHDQTRVQPVAHALPVRRNHQRDDVEHAAHHRRRRAQWRPPVRHVREIRAQPPDRCRKRALLEPHFAQVPAQPHADWQHVHVRRQMIERAGRGRHHQRITVLRRALDQRREQVPQILPAAGMRLVPEPPIESDMHAVLLDG